MTKIGLLVKIEMYRSGNAGTQDVESAVDAYTEALLKQCIVSGSFQKADEHLCSTVANINGTCMVCGRENCH